MEKEAMDLLRLLDAHRALPDTYIIEFFTNSLWTTVLPPSWQAALDAASQSDEATLATVERLLTGKTVASAGATAWPLSLLSLVATVHRAIRPRHPASTSTSTTVVQQRPLPPWLTWGTIPKKTHELTRLAPVVAHAVATVTTRTGQRPKVIDVGCGVGHLARVLASELHVHVVGIEGDGDNVKTARYLNEQMDKRTRSRRAKAVAAEKEQQQLEERPMVDRVHVVHARVDPHVEAASFRELVGLNGEEEGEKREAVLVGLHTCGDLAATLLRRFVDMDGIRAVVSIGCCYMHIGEPDCFPLSEVLKRQNVQLGWKMRESACHSLDMYLDDIRRHGVGAFKIHAYRAALEQIVRDHDPSCVREQAGSVRNGTDSEKIMCYF